MRGHDSDGTAWDGGLVPAVEVRFVKPSGGVYPIGTYGLVDSGADRSVLPVAWARRLGIDLDRDCTPSQGRTAGGRTTNFEYDRGLDVLILGQRITLQAAFNKRLPWVLLGRDDFFERFRVTFDQRERRMTLARYS